jgi:phage-related protein
MALSAGAVSLPVRGDAKGFGANLFSDLKGMGGEFGGIGKHIGGLIVGGLGAVGVATSIGAVFRAGFEEYGAADKLNAQFAAGMTSTKNVANLSVKGMNDLAASISGYSGMTDESIGASEQLLQTFTNIRNVGPDKIFDQATAATADMAAKMGGDASSNAILLGKALNDPVKGLTALTRVGVTFTQGQKDQIAAMTKAGDTVGAQKVILAELQTEFGGAAAAAGSTLPGAINKSKVAFDEMSKTIVTGLVPVMLPAINGVAAGMVKVTPMIEGFETKVGDAFKLIKGSFTGKGADVDMGKWTNPLINAGAMIRTVVDTIKLKVAGMWTTFKPVFVALGGVFASLGPQIMPLIPQVMGLAGSFSPLSLLFKAILPILPQLIPMIAGLAGTIAGALGQAIGIVLPILTQIVAAVFPELVNVIQTLLPIVMNLVGVMGPVLSTIFTALMPIISQVAGVILTLVVALMPVIDCVVQLVATLLPPLIQLFMAILPPVLAVVSVIVAILVPVLKVVIEVITWIVQVVISALIAAFNDVMVIIPKVGAVFGAIGDMIKGGFNGVVSFVKGIFNTITGLVNGVIDGINQATSVAGAIGVHIGVIPHLPTLAAGATVLPTPGGTVVRVAEAGRAETVVDTGKMNALLDRVLAGGTNGAASVVDLSDKSAIKIVQAAHEMSLNLSVGQTRTNDNTRTIQGRRW